ncbi:MAG: hypothetical protein KDB53_10790 [Planctomycetes bacterium]|nr:hypothetical protein [Planctomycetota bacterium]
MPSCLPVFLIVCLAAETSTAQSGCLAIIGDDGFSVPCCTTATLSLPAFQAVTVGGVYFCVKKCTSTTEHMVSVSISAPATFAGAACDEFQSGMTITSTGPSGVPTFVIAFLQMKYSRTWIETDSLAQVRQVWRFLINGRLTFFGSDPTPCPLPPCIPSTGSPWFHGFIDYISEDLVVNAAGGHGVQEGSSSGGSDCVALSLSHFNGCMAHFNDPSFNSQAMPPGPNRHDDFSYHLVAPTPFTVGTKVIPLPAGGVPAIALTGLDAVRSSRSILAPMCLAESPLLSNSSVLSFSHQDCFCIPPATGVLPLIYHMVLFGMDSCNAGNQFAAIPNIPNFPPTGFAQEFLGQWALPAGSFPETRLLWANGAIVDYPDDGCGTSVQPGGHLTHGVDTVYPPQTTTINLFTAPGTLTKMVDFCNSLVVPSGTMIQLPQVGSSSRSALVWQLSF